MKSERVVSNRRRLNTRFLARAIIGVLALTAAALVLMTIFLQPILAYLFPAYFLDVPLGPTPLPPTVNAARGAMPPTPGGLSEWKRAPGGDYQAVGSGFFLRLPSGAVVALTTAHSVGVLGAPGNPVERMAFARPQSADIVAEFDTLFGPPGVPRTGDDFTVDYVLLKVDQPIDESLVLAPDPRGAPQLGERVSIYSGLGPDAAGQSVFPGTVVDVTSQGAWVQMDGTFDPGGMSGSPFISQHTGQVVGMAIAGARVGDVRLIGIHPIGHLVQLAETAAEFPKLIEYRR